MKLLCTVSGYSALALANLLCASMVALLAIVDSTGKLWWPLCRLWGKIIYWGAWSPVYSQGFESLDWDQPCVLMANHQSYMDVPAIVSACPTPIRFVARKAVFSTPLLGRAMRATGQISIDRSDRDQAIASLQAAAIQISEGRTVLVFPEGTRSHDGGLQSFKKGGFMLAIDAQVPIIPIGVNGTHSVVPRGKSSFQAGKVGVWVGEPIETKGMAMDDRDALMRDVRAALEHAEKQAELLWKNPR